MHIFTSRENVLERLVGTRLCLLLVLVFACFVDRFNSSDAAATNTNGAPFRRFIKDLTDVQLNSVVTIEFKNIDKDNKTALKIAYKEVRREILEYLNRKKQITSCSTEMASETTAVATTSYTSAVHKSTVATTTVYTTTNPPTTTIALASTDVVTSTTPITTSYTAQTTTSAAPTTSRTTTYLPTPDPYVRKRRRRNSDGNNDTYTDENIVFIDIGPEFDKHGNLVFTIFIDKEGDDHDLFEILKILNKTGELKHIAPVERIYRGLPPIMATADLQVWLPILLAIFLLLIVIVFVCCWKATHKKMKDEERKKIIPKLDSKRASSNGHAAGPRILDDNCGWIIPYDQFTNEK